MLTLGTFHLVLTDTAQVLRQVPTYTIKTIRKMASQVKLSRRSGVARVANHITGSAEDHPSFPLPWHQETGKDGPLHIRRSIMRPTQARYIDKVATVLNAPFATGRYYRPCGCLPMDAMQVHGLSVLANLLVLSGSRETKDFLRVCHGPTTFDKKFLLPNVTQAPTQTSDMKQGLMRRSHHRTFELLRRPRRVARTVLQWVRIARFFIFLSRFEGHLSALCVRGYRDSTMVDILI